MMEDQFEPAGEPLSQEELERFSTLMGTTPQPDEKQNQFTFINNIVLTDDTTRVGNVTVEELGQSRYPIRSYKDFALISSETGIMDNEFFEKYFTAESEIVTSTSLSKEGFLDKLNFTQKREIADTTKRKKISRGWFKKPEEPEPSYVETGGYAA